MKKVNLKLKHSAVSGIVVCIDEMLRREWIEEESLLLFAVLAELNIKLKRKLVIYQQGYNFKIAAHYALALRIFYIKHFKYPNSYLGNVLLQISNTVHQQYQ